MTYERLITAVDEVAPELSDIAYKLLWRLIALAIHRGTPEVEASLRRLAAGLKLSKEGVARATRELAQFIKVTARDGEGTTFSLPPDWFPPQRTLFSDETLGGDFHNRPTSQDTSVLFPRTPASHEPGHQRPISQDTRPISQDASVPFPRTPVLASRTQRPISQDAAAIGPTRNAPARVDRSIDPNLMDPELIVRVDRAVQTVELLPNQREDADLLRHCLIDYRDQFPSKSRMSDVPDDVVLAHILAITDIEQLCHVLRTLLQHPIPPGHSDMWFFFTLMDKILGAPKEIVHDRMAAAKAKARSYNANPSLFGGDLVRATAAKVRKIG